MTTMQLTPTAKPTTPDRIPISNVSVRNKILQSETQNSACEDKYLNGFSRKKPFAQIPKTQWKASHKKVIFRWMEKRHHNNDGRIRFKQIDTPDEIISLPWQIAVTTRMHSSRMRTACSLSYGGVERDPPDRTPPIETPQTETPLGQRHPPGQRPRPPL